MDGASARALAEIAKDARTRLRRQEPDAAAPVAERHQEMLEALDWFVEHGQPDAAFELASVLVPFWISTKRIDDGDTWFTRVLAEALGSKANRARACHDHGYLVFWAGRYDLASRRFAESRELAASLGDAKLEALALAGLARVALDSDADEAVRLLREALALTEGLDDADEGRSGTLHVLGVALQMSGDLEGAREVMTHRLTLGRERGDAFVVWVESANLSMVERRLGNLDRAEELVREALSIDAGRGDEMSIAWTVNGLAAVMAAKGDLARAATLSASAAAMLARAGGEWPPDERQQYDETVAAATGGLAPDDLQRARDRGSAMGADEAVAFALAASDGQEAT